MLLANSKSKGKGEIMATNSKEYNKNYYKNNERRREYKRLHEQQRRAAAKGFDLALARRLYGELLSRGVCPCDARWAVLDAANRGCFGYVKQR